MIWWLIKFGKETKKWLRKRAKKKLQAVFLTHQAPTDEWVVIIFTHGVRPSQK